jgi:hypothetical protein
MVLEPRDAVRLGAFAVRFTLARGETIHLNIAADPTYDPSNPALPNMQEEGLLEIQRMDPEQEYGRAITSSEYRHARWLVEHGRAGKGNVNFYSEIKDPPPPVVVVPGPAPVKKKKWYKPWTRFR